MNKADYSEYLNHPLWQKKRDEVFLKYGRKCSENECHSVKDLVIHHKTYSSGKMLWEYPIENFEVLCGKHHATRHGHEYTSNKCKWKDSEGKVCGIEISTKYEYCWPHRNELNNELIKEKEAKKKELEDKIADLENSLQRESNKKDNESLNKTHQLKEEIESLTKEKTNLEKNITELRIIDDKFKKEIKTDIKNIESKIDILQREKNSKDNASKEKQQKLEEEIVRLKKEMDNLKQTLEESKRIEKIKETITAKNQKIESKINLLIIGLVLFAVIIIIIAIIIVNKESSTNNAPYPVPQEITAVDKKEKPPVNDIINNPSQNEKNKTLPRVETPAPNVNKRETNELKETKRNDKVFIPSPAQQSSYKVISIDEINSNVGNKVQISEKISQVTYSQNGTVYLNIGGSFPRNKLSLVIFKNNVDNFGDLKKFENQFVKAKGKISTYKGKAEIVINKNWQLQEIE